MYKSASRFLQAQSRRAALKESLPRLSKEKRADAIKMRAYLKKWRKIAEKTRKSGKALDNDTRGKVVNALPLSSPEQAHVDALALKQRCPHCGKIKRGLNAHIAAKHSRVATKPPDGSVQQPESPIAEPNEPVSDTVKSENPTSIEDWMKEHFQEPRLPDWAQPAVLRTTAKVSKRPSPKSAKSKRSKSR
jgi:hypothetical protein